MAVQREFADAAAITPNGLLLAICGWGGIVGAVAVIGSNVVGSIVVPGYDWVADTISNLAAGRYEIIQDVGLYAFAGSLIACALGTSHVHPGTDCWSLGVIATAIMAAFTVVIGARNEYGDGDGTATWDVHLGVVYTLMLLFLATTVLMARGLDVIGARYRTGSMACTGLFVVAAAAYFMTPTGYDGLVERAVALIAIGWVTMVSAMLLHLRTALACNRDSRPGLCRRARGTA